MGDRIKELYKEAYGISRSIDDFVLHSDDQRFAKLLIKECATFVDENTGYDARCALDRVEGADILNHFGVE